MRNNIPDILNRMVESLKKASKLVGFDLIFLEKEPEQILHLEEGSEFVSLTYNYKIEYVTKIFVFRDFKPHFVLSARTDIRKFLPLLYSNNIESGINPKHFIFQFFGDAGFLSEDERLASDLPNFSNGDDIWIWGPPLQNPLRETCLLPRSPGGGTGVSRWSGPRSRLPRSGTSGCTHSTGCRNPRT